MNNQKKQSIWNRRMWGGLLILSMIALDQISKNCVLLFVSNKGFIHCSKFLNIVCTLNKGISFGVLGQGYKWQIGFIFVLTSLMSIWLLKQYWNAEKTSLSLFYSLIIGGAIGNFIDRVMHGAVIDFIDFHIDNIHWYPLTFHIKDWHWPAFNIADASIVCGVILLTGYHIVQYLRVQLKHS